VERLPGLSGTNSTYRPVQISGTGSLVDGGQARPQPDASGDAEGPDDDPDKPQPAPLHPETTWDALEKMWIWAYAPIALRERFHEKLRRAR
jgi:hypothetical protein